MISNVTDSTISPVKHESTLSLWRIHDDMVVAPLVLLKMYPC